MANIFELFDKIKTGGSHSSGAVEYLIVGLGNPGERYAHTRHNVGFMAVDTIAKQFGVEIKRSKFKGLTTTCTISGKQCLLLKPTTFMNLSGESVEAAASYYNIPMEHVLVLFDDISLEPSRLRIRRKGSHGGHNGIRNIIDMTGEEDFPRIKIGVGKKPNPNYDLADWVLSSFTSKEMEGISEAIQKAVKATELIIAGEIDKAMNLYNS
ncbi:MULTISPECIES: aminoacyl-tRNA hydrolase [Clostridiaceae]|uniref:Peptidyl-tRNA hydrolase n=1 Tax=Clostridium facile TaxID=2763035 RepID=A0ABR7ITL2_9CLOT|nr:MULTISPECIES: aminoacyl-tRNA hydrolase [Clostridiaceae]MBC5788495.1 aminoacyl-tRNA hydrolase [Clostridium facile]